MTSQINKMHAVRLASAAAAALVTALIFVTLATPVAADTAGTQEAATRATDPSVARGRYLVAITGCNDCHTAGYAETGGKVSESDWLLGMPVGYQGPWGTTYPANLRLTVQNLSEAQWIQFARAERLPPMPWFALRDMNDDDLRAMYRFIRSLGAKGTRMPNHAAPGDTVSTPVINLMPQTAPTRTAAR